MKLIFCTVCEDMVKLMREERRCRCGRSGGAYVGDLEAEVFGDAVPVGISNESFLKAVRTRGDQESTEFTAFVIPRACHTVHVRKGSSYVGSRD